MRTPTPINAQYTWWCAAIRDPSTVRHDADPQPGFYQRRAVRGGPWLPVRVWLEQSIDAETGDLADDEVIHAEELGRPIDARANWTYLRAISEAEYRDLVARHEAMPEMKATHARVDLGAAPVRIQRKS